MISNLESIFREYLELPQDAVAWLIDLWKVTQFFDDVFDEDVIPKEEFNAALWATMVRMPANPFFLANGSILGPVVAAMVLKWHGANTAESNGSADAKSFVWRAGYYDVVLMVCFCIHGQAKTTDMAHKVMGIYGETLQEYLREFENA